ncbi:putative transcription factor C2H2 family [Rosa chinensis]|uniref:Putative transcription factor C2H2 family n=1 Tax=Rosa chinensis TaxID=74649 RepID=A0A2P6R4H0_ROSCH|nr:protein indeterminate-domain 5, chloroplastic [Rosa chinensis]PRQ41325.1 putative transcription factor C2H2 family [Rosa chinensis]
MAASSSSLFGIREEDQNLMKQQQHSSSTPTSSTAAAPLAPPPQKKKRNQPGTPNPEAEVIALSPKTLMATNRFICEVCNKGFQREQNLQLHRRGHNLPWKLKQKTTKEPKRKVYLCPEPTCVHHDPSRALGDLTGIKKHFSRKHGEKKWKCDKCSKRYAVQSDWKAHSKTCGTREYRCDCGTLFSRRDSFITHRAFCDALAQESARHQPNLSSLGSNLYGGTSNTGLALSHHHHQQQVVGPNIDHHHHNNQSTAPADILRLGGGSGNARTGQFDHLLSPPSMGSSFRPAQSSAPFFINQDQSSQQYHHDQEQLQSKQFHGLMQFSDHQNNNSSSGGNLFNLPFLSNSSNSNNSNNAGGANSTNLLLHPDHQYNSNGGEGGSILFSGHMMGGGGGDHMSSGNVSSLYSSQVQNNHHGAGAAVSHMSATALLQKAAQMGSTTSSNNTSASLLRSFGSTSSTKSERPAAAASLVPANLGGIFGGGSENENNLQDLMNSFAAGGSSSIFGSGSFGSGFHDVASRDEPKLPAVSIVAGSDRLTRDFLGVGQIVRSMSGGQQQTQIEHMSSLDSESNAAPSTQSFGGGGNF